jgi:outer membrane receptor protein involved in Fe transport
MTGASHPIHAQNKMPGIITGKVMDSKTLAPVEYANIVVLDTLTKKMVTGVVTDSTGHFRIVNVPFGTYFVDYSFIGYSKQRTKAFTIGLKKTKADLGTLNLDPAAVTMEEVTVTAEKSMMITKIDRKVFNVQQDITAQTGTVLDILQNIPSVSVDMDGNISLRGSSNVTILINGRPSLMTGSANLEQMPASLIDRIEVITNPSARYKPDGTAGIINIILKKERKAGFNGSAGGNVSNHDRFNTNVQLNLNTGKVNLYGSYGFRQDYRFRTRNLYSLTMDTVQNQSVYLWQNTEGTSRPRSHLAQLGADWSITKKDVAGISGSYNYREVLRNEMADNTYKDSVLQPSEIFSRTLDGKEYENSFDLTSYYEHTFSSDPEHILKIDLNYTGDSEKSDDRWTTIYQLPFYPVGEDHSYAINKGQEINLTADYTCPLWENGSLETGYEGDMEITDQDQQVESRDPDSGQWIADLASSNRYHAVQSVHALFITISSEFGKFSIMGGLRAEEALINLDFRSSDTIARTSYFALYPTIHMSVSSGNNEWQLNYSRRVNRPDVDEMNPVPEYRDPRNVFIGNPHLKPEDIHSIEAGYSFNIKKLTIVPTLFYRYKIHGFTTVTYNLNDTVLATTMDNLAKDQSAGLDLSGNWQIGKVANINFSGSGFYNRIDASNIGYSSNKSTFAFNAKVNASFNITKTTMLQCSGQVYSKTLTPQGMRYPSWVLNLGFRQDFWKKRISLIATVSDVFNSQLWKTTVNTDVLQQENIRHRDAPVIFGGILFNFGTREKKEKEPKFEFDNGSQ